VKYILTFFISSIFFVSLGAAMSNNSINENPNIIEYGTKQFEDFVKTAKISPQEAYNIVMSAIEKIPDGTYATLLYICVNNEYHFTSLANKVNYIKLSGFYVNATTGKYRFIQKNERYKLRHINHSMYFMPKE